MESVNSHKTTEIKQADQKNDVISPGKLKREVYAVFGLGNPNREHIGTRHNVGYDFIEYLANNIHQDASLSNRKFFSHYGETTIAGRKVFLVQPQTFMNLSGKAVRDLAAFYKIKHKRVIVVHDDLDLPLGTLRLKNKGSSGGQNGVEDILRHIGKDSDFIRIRVGIGKPATMDPAKYVLKKFLLEEVPLVELTWKRIYKAIETIIGEDLPKAMTLFNKSLEQFEKQEQDEIRKKKRQDKLEALIQKHANNNNTENKGADDNKKEEEDTPQEEVKEDGTSSPPAKRIKADT